MEELTPEMGRLVGFSTLKDLIKKVTQAAKTLWASLTSHQDSVDFTDPASYVPDVSVISEDPERIKFLLFSDSK